MAVESEGHDGAGGAIELEHLRRTLKERLFRTTAAPLKVGRFVVLERLGEGAMGVVLSAYDPLLDRKVAIKILRANPGGVGERQRLRMLREARALARLEHPNALGIFEVGEHEGAVFLVTAFVRGRTLRAWFAAGPHPVAEVLRVMIAAGQGLAAAHAAGVVHRDFKPENVMLAEDGPVRVLDFGLAALHDHPEPPAPGRADEAAWPADRTRTGARLGTPAYMAPEQRSGARPDARSDQYSFCAVLHEGLVGARVPDAAGATGPASPRVPSWLAAIVARGLDPDPAARWPSMQRLLAALTEDPAAARRRRLRGLAVAGLLVVLGGLVAALLGAGSAAWSRLRREREAEARLAAIEPRIEQRTAEGQRGEARELLREFSELAGLRGTAAHDRAWLRQAARERAAGDVGGTVESLAEVDVDALAGAEREAALRELAEVLRDDHDWFSMAAVLGPLADDELRDSPELRGLAVTAAAAGRELARARDLSVWAGPEGQADDRAPLLAALASVTATGQVAHLALALDHDGDGTRELLLRREHPGVAGSLSLARLEPGLAPLAAIEGASPGFVPLAVVAGAAGDRVLGWDGEDAVLMSLGPGAPRELLRRREGSVTQAVGADVDGDGRAEPYVGTGPYSRRLLALREEAGAWTVAVAEPGTRGSDITALLGADLDGDRVDELVVGAGPWRAYDVRVLKRGGADGALRLAARRQLGHVTGLATLRGPDGARRLVAVESERSANLRIFPEERPNGAPAGLYLFDLVDGTLIDRGFLPAPRRVSDGLPLDLTGVQVGDLDGDGREELVVHARRLVRAGEAFQSPLRGHEHELLIYRQLDDGGFAPVLIGGLAPLALVELDGDPGRELIVRDAAGDSRLFVLGAGAGTIAPLVGAAGTAGSAAAEPWVAEVERRAARLVQLGLRERASRLLERTAEAVTGEVQASLRVRAAQLSELDQQYRRSASLHELAARASAIREVELTAAVHDYLRAGSYADAARAAGSLARESAGGPRGAEVAALRSLAQSLAAQQAATSGRFAGPLAPAWQIVDPLALRRVPEAAALQVHAFADQSTIAWLPIRWDARHLSLEVELDLVRIEWSAGLLFELAPEGEGEAMTLRILSGGGGGIAEHHVLCGLPGRARGKFFVPPGGSTTGQPPRRVVVRLEALPLLGEWSCTLAEPDGRVIRRERGPLAGRPTPGAYRLRIAGLGGRPEETSAWAELWIRRLVLIGAEVATPPRSEPIDPFKRALVEGDPATALRLDVPARREPGANAWWEIAALLELGRWREVESRLRGAAGVSAGATDRAHLLRTHRAAFVPVLRGADPDGFSRLFWRAWSAALTHGTADAVADRALLFDLADAPLIAAEGPVEAYVLELLLLRARALTRASRWVEAEADVTAALRAVGEGRVLERESGDGSSAEIEAALRIELASLEVRDGRTSAAHRHVAEALARAEDRFYVQALIRRRPELARWAEPAPVGTAEASE